MGTNGALPVVAIVDDDESVARAIKRLVGCLGFNARTFGSGQAFLDVLEQVPSFAPQCIVLDVQMPGLSGLDVQERLNHLGQKIGVIVITAHDDRDSHRRALSLGATTVLLKPFQDDVFLDSLRRALESAGDQQA
jgi:FixJ family two-component response regulator